MRISKNKTLYSPTDLNNFVSCKYHIKNDLLADEKKLEDINKVQNKIKFSSLYVLLTV